MQETKPAEEKIPAPPMLDIMIMQLDGAIGSLPAPEYVKKATNDFVEALKRWQKEGV